MRLRVKNLGPILLAELDLSEPLIILTGPNNSGKTYLAWAAHSISKVAGGFLAPPKKLRVWAEQLLAVPNRTVDFSSLFECRDAVLRTLATAVQKRLPRDFAAPRDHFNNTRLKLIPSPQDDEKFLSLKGSVATLHTDHKDFLFEVANEKLSLSIKAHGTIGEDASSDRTDVTVEDIAQLACLVLMFKYVEADYVTFPVERLAINLFARELAAERTDLVDELLSDETHATKLIQAKLRQRAGRYPQAIRDALQRAIRTPNEHELSVFADLAEELELSVLGGSIKTKNHGELTYIPHQSTGNTTLGLHQTASVVKSLVSLVLYLRHEAKPEQRLVIDEPELNLHPDNQRRVTRILAKAVNRGLRIMMSTHSDYVIREINNLVMLGQDSDKARALAQELGYQSEQTLRRDQIGAYLVNDGTCRRLDVNKTGFETKTIEDEIHKLNQDSQTIYFRLFED